jgi:hypothetical protein
MATTTTARDQNHRARHDAHLSAQGVRHRQPLSPPSHRRSAPQSHAARTTNGTSRRPRMGDARSAGSPKPVDSQVYQAMLRLLVLSAPRHNAPLTDNPQEYIGFLIYFR